LTPNYIVRNVVRPDIATIDAFAPLGVATVHEAAGRTGLLSPAVVARQDDVAISGSAVTVSSHPGDNLMIHAAVELCRPGDIVIVTTTSPSTDGMFGELLATSLMARGVRGLVTDAGVRDIAALRRLGFPVWSRAIHAQGTVKATGGSVNVPVVCAGQLINPGDVIVADDDGVARVRRAAAARVLEAARARTANEEKKRVDFASGTLGLDMYDLRPLLERLGVKYVDTPPDDDR
jgi:4-hydroxy-4-methyl-2-oxoglutarate aldolase